MSRRWLETVSDFPSLHATVLYRLGVTEIDKSPGGKEMRVTLAFEDAGLEGRTHEVLLPLPIRPSGLTAQFFRACGLDVSLGGKLAPKDVINRVVGARFAPIDGVWNVVAFKPLSTCEDRHDAAE